MPVEYRLLRGAEVDSAADLWVVYGPGIETPSTRRGGANSAPSRIC